MAGFLDFIFASKKVRTLKKWEKAGRPAPPPHYIKQQAIEEYQSTTGCTILVETGTFKGDMVFAQKDNFEHIYSIELSEKLFEEAKKRFVNNKNVTILQGDSGKVLHTLIKEIKSPAIFWLDGHYSAGETAKGEKDCPIYEELSAIFSEPNPGHIILIDDARCFNGAGDYPTIEALTAFIKQKDPAYKVTVKDDLIRYSLPRHHENT